MHVHACRNRVLEFLGFSFGCSDILTHHPCFSGKFPVGVAKYLTWPQTTWATRVTCTHHLWTLPLLLSTSGGQVPPSALGLSFVFMVLNVCLSRAMIPLDVNQSVRVPQIQAGSNNQDEKNFKLIKQSKYLNVNLSHELWKDIKIGILQINYDNPPVFLYLFRLLWRWQCFNTIVYFTLVLLGKVAFAGNHHVCKPIVSNID